MPREGHDLMAPIPVRFAMVISIHVPREGHDGWSRAKKNCCFTYFNPRAPRGARRQDNRQQIAPKKFQSTCPARGTTLPGKTPYVARIISIHVPREGHDLLYSFIINTHNLFQSTCPARGTTYIARSQPGTLPISIHVPREGHDVYFVGKVDFTALFQSTCPARGTTRAAR